MRIRPIAVILFSALTIPAYAASLDNKNFDQQSIDALEQRATQAQPREQCFLYAQLVHEIVEVSARQYAAGNFDNAQGMLKRAQEFTHRLHIAIAKNDKRLKDAQILLRHTAFRLTEMLHSSMSDDRPLVEQTLTQLNAAQNDAMLQVFRK